MSSASDMTKWMKFLMEKMNHSNTPEHSAFRKLFSERILLPSDYREGLRKDMTALNIRIAYAMGLMTSNYNGYMTYFHSGDIHGYSSSLLMIPEVNSAAYIAVNGPCNQDIFSSLAYMSIYIRDLLVGRDPWVNRTTLCLEDSRLSNTSLENSTTIQYSINDTVKTAGLGENVISTTIASGFVQPIQTYVGRYGNNFIGDLYIEIDPNRTSSLCLILGRMLVADLIPTDNETVFTAFARLPLLATKEWETPFSVSFLEEEALPESTETRNQAKLISDSTVTPTKRFQEILVAWGGERSVFRRNVRFADCLQYCTDKSEELKTDTMPCSLQCN